MHRKYKVAVGVCLLGVAIDQVTKGIVKSALGPGEYAYMGKAMNVWPGFMEFRYAENTGMAFGVDLVGWLNLSNFWRTPIFIAITLVAAAIIFHLLRQAPDKSIRLSAGLGFILAGAFGNLIDRFRWGYVVDFIRVTYWPPSRSHWPTFNMADTFISIGIALLLIDAVFAGAGEEEQAEADDAAEPEVSACASDGEVNHEPAEQGQAADT